MAAPACGPKLLTSAAPWSKKWWRLMTAWPDYCAKSAPAGTVVNLRLA
jgi:hypothetical protein